MGDDIQLRWRRDLQSFVAMVIAAIVVTTIAGLVLPTRFAWISQAEDLDHALALMLLPGILGMGAMAAVWYLYPYLVSGHERWPFGAREVGGSGRRLSDVVVPNLVGFAVARLVPAPFGIVSSIYVDQLGMGMRVDAPVDVASRFVIFLAGYTISWIVTFAIVQRVRLTWTRLRARTAPPTTAIDAA